MLDPDGAASPGACLEYPPSQQIDFGGLAGLLAADGWARASTSSVLAHLSAPSPTPRDIATAVSQLNPDELDGLTVLSGTPATTPVPAYMAARLRTSAGQYRQLLINFAGPGESSGIVAIGVRDDQTVDFIMDCGRRYTQGLASLVGRADGATSPAGVVEDVITRPDGRNARLLASGPTDAAESDAPPVTSGGPAAGTSRVTVWFDVPDSWASIDGTLCPKLPRGWSTCVAFDALASGLVPLDVNSSGTLEWYLLDANATLSDPIARLGAVDAAPLVAEGEGAVVVRASREASTQQELIAAAEAARRPGAAPLFSVGRESLRDLEASLQSSAAENG